MSTADVLVVGGGPAGLAVAIGAARAGMDVLVCERRDGPIDKACGEGLMPAAVASLRRLGVDVPGQPIRGIRYLDATRCATAQFRHGPGRGVRRTVLHETLRDAALAAGVTICHRAIETIHQDADRVSADGIRARYLVGADGLHSRVRVAAGLDLPARGRPRWGLRRHFAVPAADLVEVHWAAGSEAYVTPVAQDIVGVAVLSAARGSFDEQLGAFPWLLERLAGAEPVSQVRGAGPLRQRTRGRVAGRVLLVGDAAGYVDALTGEGVAVSLATAEALVRCLVEDRPDRYERAWSRMTWRSRALTAGLLWTRNRPWGAPAIVPAAARLPAVFARAVDQLAEG